MSIVIMIGNEDGQHHIHISWSRQAHTEQHQVCTHTSCTVQYSTVQYSTVQYSTVQQMLPLSSHRFYILQSNHLNDFYLLLPPFCLLLASVKLCLGSRVAVLGANGAGEQQPLNSFLLSYILLLLLFCSLLLWLPVEPVAPPW
jgi:hypothetical protein